jgi:hypothetical protein
MLYLIACAIVLMIAGYLVLHDWGITRLHWRYFTTDSCRRFLKATGWKIVWEGDPLLADKGTLRIMMDCVDVDVATVTGMVSSLYPTPVPDRQYVILVPGTIQPGVVDEMLTREVSVIALSQLGSLEAILEAHRRRVEAVRAYKVGLTEASRV